ncbi:MULTISPECIES: hypothetical protein [Actinosynnema]|uniref:hypothetical protein n=1 Tax=Actinosynnema TaxID=40566 RepID=UPI0020A45C89|nr:hypothetical protein [Actinosynnema pretiosum]
MLPQQVLAAGGPWTTQGMCAALAVPAQLSGLGVRAGWLWQWHTEHGRVRMPLRFTVVPVLPTFTMTFLAFGYDDNMVDQATAMHFTVMFTVPHTILVGRIVQYRLWNRRPPTTK